MNTQYPQIALQGVEGLIFVYQQEVIYAIANKNYTQVYLTKNRERKVLKQLKEVEALLSKESFIRIHRSYLINLQHVIRFQSETNSVIMSDSKSLEVSRNRKAEFIEKFTRL